MYGKLKVIEFKLKEAGQAVSTPEAVFNVLKDDFSALSEEMYLLICDVKNKILQKTLIAKGGSNMIHITPADIFRPALIAGGLRFIIAHSHPSGDPTPSEEDIKFTKKIHDASKILGLNILDHIVFTNEKYYSFKKHSLL